MSMILDPPNTDHIVIIVRDSRVYYMTMSGKVVNTAKLKGGHFSKKNTLASQDSVVMSNELKRGVATMLV